MSIIRTSYYYKVRNKAEDYYKVAISLTAPTGEYDSHAVKLAPTQDMLWYYKNSFISEAEYTRMYKEELKKNGESELAIAYQARRENYAKICSKTIITSRSDGDYGAHAFFYDSAEGLLTACILLVCENAALHVPVVAAFLYNSFKSFFL